MARSCKTQTRPGLRNMSQGVWEEIYLSMSSPVDSSFFVTSVNFFLKAAFFAVAFALTTLAFALASLAASAEIPVAPPPAFLCVSCLLRSCFPTAGLLAFLNWP